MAAGTCAQPLHLQPPVVDAGDERRQLGQASSAGRLQQELALIAALNVQPHHGGASQPLTAPLQAWRPRSAAAVMAGGAGGHKMAPPPQPRLPSAAPQGGGCCCVSGSGTKREKGELVRAGMFISLMQHRLPQGI